VTDSGLPEESAGHQASDVQQLTEEIERARERLGAAVEQLAARADVKSRARAQAADLAGRARSAGAKAGRQAAVRTGSTAGALGEKVASARRKATAAGHLGKEQSDSGAAEASQEVPGPARQAISKAGGVARDKRVLCSLAAGAALAVAALVIWQRSRR
jgi:Protein of unknown function (DUF3618)